MLVFKIKIKLNKFKSDYWAQDTKGCVTNTKVSYPSFRLKIPRSVLKITVVRSLVNIRFVQIIAHIGIQRVGIWNPSLENLVYLFSQCRVDKYGIKEKEKIVKFAIVENSRWLPKII